MAVTLLQPVAVNAQGMPDLSLSMIQAELSRIGTDLGKIQKGNLPVRKNLPLKDGGPRPLPLPARWCFRGLLMAEMSVESVA